MKSRVCSGALVAAAMLLCSVPLNAATLSFARASVDLEPGGSCRVVMAFAVESERASEVSHRLFVPEGSDVRSIEITGAPAGASERAGRVVVVRVSLTGRGRYEARYEVGPLDRSGRCPLLVPDTPTDGISRAVEIAVTIPPGARRLPGEFPALAWTDATGRVTLGHVPAFVLVRLAPAGGDPGWRDTLDVRRLNDVAAMVILLGATVIWAVRRRRTR